MMQLLNVSVQDTTLTIKDFHMRIDSQLQMPQLHLQMKYAQSSQVKKM